MTKSVRPSRRNASLDRDDRIHVCRVCRLRVTPPPLTPKHRFETAQTALGRIWLIKCYWICRECAAVARTDSVNLGKSTRNEIEPHATGVLEIDTRKGSDAKRAEHLRAIDNVLCRLDDRVRKANPRGPPFEVPPGPEDVGRPPSPVLDSGTGGTPPRSTGSPVRGGSKRRRRG